LSLVTVAGCDDEHQHDDGHESRPACCHGDGHPAPLSTVALAAKYEAPPAGSITDRLRSLPRHKPYGVGAGAGAGAGSAGAAGGAGSAGAGAAAGAGGGADGAEFWLHPIRSTVAADNTIVLNTLAFIMVPRGDLVPMRQCNGTALRSPLARERAKSWERLAAGEFCF